MNVHDRAQHVHAAQIICKTHENARLHGRAHSFSPEHRIGSGAAQGHERAHSEVAVVEELVRYSCKCVLHRGIKACKVYLRVLSDRQRGRRGKVSTQGLYTPRFI